MISDGAFAAEETFFFDTFFLLVVLTDFTVFFEEDFFAEAFFAETFFADDFPAADFFEGGFDRVADAGALRDDTRAFAFELFFLLAALVAFFAAAFFAGIARASEGLNETGDYTYAQGRRK